MNNVKATQTGNGNLGVEKGKLRIAVTSITSRLRMRSFHLYRSSENTGKADRFIRRQKNRTAAPPIDTVNPESISALFRIYECRRKDLNR
ncbi:MAG: hypothetical protein ACLTMH_15045 [Faecalimonas umbilicata]|uniref:hypothetical protein n=1 Tax=Faecalimonas umbilicata TaxID=1912855 RepID=UPI00399405EA